VSVRAPLSGVRVVECSMLGPAAITSALVDLGAEVIKVEPPAGDYIRGMTWPIVEGVSLMHLHVNRGKRSVTLDLRSVEGKQVFCDLAEHADVVVEAMRPGALERLGLGPSVLRERQPALVFASISGYGATGPYKD
jgi:crotonobetainyl-CoA:carnitine CoA-transferase CaiB-like acyl-CoA transferase